MMLKRSLTLKVLFTVLLVALIGSAAVQASTVTIVQSEVPLTMDPSNHTATYTAAVLYPMYEGLTEFDQEANVVPALATDWSASEDGTEWTFQLRQGVVFHDGTPFNAEAVKVSYERVLDPANGLAVHGRYAAVIDRIEVVSDYVVKFHLKAPYPSLPRLLATTNAPIVSPTAIKEFGNDYLARNAVGTGPYKFVEWRTGEYVLMEKNTEYWGEVPEVDQLVWKWTPESAVRAMAVQTGEADVAFPLPPAYAAVLDRDPTVTVLESPSNRVFWLALNTLYEPLTDIRVRQALNYAVNRDALVQSLLWGHGTAANSVMAPLTFGYDAEAPGYPYDVAKAKALLAEAGYANGFDLDIILQEADGPLAVALQGMWAEIGVNVNVRILEYGIWAEDAFGTPEEKHQSRTHSVIASWAASSLDGDLALRPLFHTNSWSPGEANLGFYSNPQVDELLNKASVIVDPAQREELYRQAQAILWEEAPHVSLYYPSNLAGIKNRVEGIWVQPSGLVVARQPRIVQ